LARPLSELVPALYTLARAASLKDVVACQGLSDWEPTNGRANQIHEVPSLLIQ
jgi:hypothetical protein